MYETRVDIKRDHFNALVDDSVRLAVVTTTNVTYNKIVGVDTFYTFGEGTYILESIYPNHSNREDADAWRKQYQLLQDYGVSPEGVIATFYDEIISYEQHAESESEFVWTLQWAIEQILHDEGVRKMLDRTADAVPADPPFDTSRTDWFTMALDAEEHDVLDCVMDRAAPVSVKKYIHKGDVFVVGVDTEILNQFITESYDIKQEATEMDFFDTISAADRLAGKLHNGCERVEVEA